MAKRNRKKSGGGAFGKNRGTKPARAASAKDSRNAVTPEFIAERDAAMAAIARKMEKQPFQDAKEMKAFLHAHLTGKSFAEIFAEEEATAEDSPQRRARFELRKIHPTQRPEVQRRHAKVALEHDPDNIEAWSALASTFANATKFEEACRKAVETGRRVFADRIEAAAKGGPGLWGFADCRPFLNACRKLAEFCSDHYRVPEAINLYEEILAWNPGDNQGIRYDLLHERLSQMDFDAAETLLDAYPDEDSCQWAYDRAWIAFMRARPEANLPEPPDGDAGELFEALTTGPFAQATKLLRKAFREYPAGPLFILDLRTTFSARSSFHTWKQASEAFLYARQACPRWIGPIHPANWLLAVITPDFHSVVAHWPVDVEELRALHRDLKGFPIPKALDVTTASYVSMAEQLREVVLQQAEPASRDREIAPGPSALADVAFRIHISLDHVHPPIWRRVLIPADITLDKLHEIIQRAMGWENDHLHLFTVGKQSYQPRDPREDSAWSGEKRPGDTAATFLGDLIPRPGGVLKYEYDFGDGWEHTIKVEEILRGDDVPALPDPVCLDGSRHCPPEDCGGPFRYANLLEALKDPKHPEHDALLEWVGGDFDPDDFDPDETTGWLEGVLEEEDGSD